MRLTRTGLDGSLLYATRLTGAHPLKGQPLPTVGPYCRYADNPSLQLGLTL
jgi:hypothetical protein